MRKKVAITMAVAIIVLTAGVIILRGKFKLMVAGQIACPNYHDIFRKELSV